eukprot:m.347624 g.347624  ORF g.347624 m.347624 type:complete len:74 (+) comp33672_c0_seq1:854-1075(+)
MEHKVRLHPSQFEGSIDMNYMPQNNIVIIKVNFGFLEINPPSFARDKPTIFLLLLVCCISSSISKEFLRRALY